MKRVISFVLWGNHPKHVQGAIENAEEAPRIYPGWEVWFYVAGNTQIIKRLEELGVRVIQLPDSRDWSTIFARMWPASEPGLERIIFRDCDSRISERDAGAVAEWIKEDKECHVMRDTPAHLSATIPGGMWGIKGRIIPNIRELVSQWLAKQEKKTFTKADAVDEKFLSQVVWPVVREKHCTVHGYGGKPFPPHKPTKHKGFVGSQVLLDEQEQLKVLHYFSHGLGDAAQFTAVLKHLAHFYPHWVNDVCSLSGKQTCFKGLCRETYTPQTRNGQAYNRTIQHGWFECKEGYADFPSTKTVRCLIQDLQIQPLRHLLSYEINVSEHAKAKAQTYFDTLPKSRGKVVIHYEGNTSCAEKNLSHEDIGEVCNLLIANDFTPIILDWDNRSPLPDQKAIFCPTCSDPLWENIGTGDAETIAALIDLADLFIGVDSGPQKIAASRTTPSLGVWTKHHPVNFIDHCDTMLHMVPIDHKDLIKGSREAPLRYFSNNYKFHEYKRLGKELLEVIGKQLDIHVPPANKVGPLNATSFHSEYYEEHKRAGLDYLGHGLWQEHYGLWIAHSFDMGGKELLDIGCAAGSIVLGLCKATIKAQGIDLNNFTIEKGKEAFKVPLFVCDAINMHLFADNVFDMVHTNQVAEHWKEKHVAMILEEIWRVMKPGALFFTVLDTEDLFIRENRNSETEDPTNGAIKPLAWWIEQCEKQGFVNVRNGYELAMKEHQHSFLKHYDWDWFLMRKP